LPSWKTSKTIRPNNWPTCASKYKTTAHKLAETRQRVAQMLARQYKSGDHDAMKLMLNADDPNQTSRDMVYYQHIAKAQQQMVTQLISHQHELEALTYQLEQELARLDALSNHKSRKRTPCSTARPTSLPS
jgi:septal ring factor EnvC (AmiA/AmiB activator)